MRIGLLGTGGIAERHAAAIKALGLDFAGCHSRDTARSAAFAERHGTTAFASLAELLDRIDLLVVALPPFARAGIVEQAAERGVHLLLEKPIALDEREAEKMVAATAGIRTQVGFMYRFGAAVERWRAIDAGRVGLFAGRYHCNALHAPWWRSRETSGGQLVEQVIHLFDLVRHLMGEPASVYGRAANLFHRQVPGYDTEDVSAVILGFADGAVATLNATNAAIPGRWTKEWHIVAERASGHFSDWNNAVLTHTAGTVAEERTADGRDVFQAQLLDLVEAIREDRPARTPIEEGEKSLRLALAARRSADQAREIAL